MSPIVVFVAVIAIVIMTLTSKTPARVEKTAAIKAAEAASEKAAGARHEAVSALQGEHVKKREETVRVEYAWVISSCY